MARRSNKETLRSEVKKYIIKGISEGKFTLGERIVETKLAKELNMSQAPVREAVLELSIMGVLEERPYAGSFIRKPDSRDIENHYKVRGVIEGYAAFQAALNRTEEDLQKLRDILHEMDECTEPDEFVDLDHNFHGTIMDATGNTVLKHIWTSVSAYEMTYQAILANKWTLRGLYDAHKKLYDVIASGNASGAAAEMYLHIDGFRVGVLETIEEKEAAQDDGD